MKKLPTVVGSRPSCLAIVTCISFDGLFVSWKKSVGTMVGQQERKADFFFLSGSDARRNKRKFSLKRARKTLRSFEIARVIEYSNINFHLSSY